MTDPVALALITAAVPVVATIGASTLTTWRAAIAAEDARKTDQVWRDKIDLENRQSIEDRALLRSHQERLESVMLDAGAAAVAASRMSAKNNAAIEVVHQAVNGGMAASKREIADLKREIARLNLVAEHGQLAGAAVVAARVVTDAAATAAGVLKSDAATASVLVTADAAIAGAALAATPAREPLDADDTDAGHRVRGTYR